MNPILKQAGAIPFRHGTAGLQVLLITSRGTGRWVIPKGGIEKGLTAAQTAELESYEEAGIKGEISATPLGHFTYAKRRRNGAHIPATVEVYALNVQAELKKFPERAQRHLKWMSIPEAIQLTDEPEIATLLLKLQQIETAELIIS